MMFILYKIARSPKKIPGFFIAIMLISALAESLNAQIIINEFMANNRSVFPDVWDYDDFSDWIELHNTADTAVSLDGYFLTDNLNNPTKWPIPKETTVPAKGFFVLRADGFDDVPGSVRIRDSYPWTDTFTTIRYHTNFKLDADGEEIGLFRLLNGKIQRVDSVIFSVQPVDVSMGRRPSDISGGWYYFDLPTPGAANSGDAKSTEKRCGEVTFNPPGGFYQYPQTVSLAAGGGGEIYYTLDCEMPSVKSLKYEAPITVGKSTVIRARCIDPNRLAGPVATHTYFIGEKQRYLMTVSVTTALSFLYDSLTGIFRNSLKNREFPVALEFFSEDGVQAVNVNAGMSLGSLSNFKLPQKPLQIKLSDDYGDDYIWYRFFSKPIACHRRLRLRQGGDAWATNLIADGMMESVFNGQMELGVQAYRPVVVFVNGQYYGIEDLREQFDDQYFINNYAIDPTTKNEVRTTLLKPDSGSSGRMALNEGWETVSGEWKSFGELMGLVTSGDINDSVRYEQVKQVVDINSCIDFFCAVSFCCQTTWTHNQDLWESDRTPWRWLAADFDRAFDIKNVNLNMFTNRTYGIIPRDTLFTALIGIKEFKNHFLQRFAAHLNSTFRPERLISIIDSLRSLILPEMADHAALWGPQEGIKSVEYWESQLDNMKTFAAQRGNYIFRHLTTEPFSAQGTAKLTIELSNKNQGTIFINDVPMCRGLDTLTFFAGIPLRLKAVPNPGFIFTGWENISSSDTVTVTITKSTSIKAGFDRSEHYQAPLKIEGVVLLDKTDAPYAAAGDIIVETDGTLAVENGVTLLMPQNACIYVRGRFSVNGTPDAPVKIKENAESGATCWGAINFENSRSENRIAWAEISGTTNGHDPLNERAGINGNNSDIYIDHLTMHNVIYPMYFEHGKISVTNSSITVDHICNGAIHIGRGTALLENNTIISTGVTINTDAIDIKGVDNCIIRGNRIYNFNGLNSDAVDLGEEAKNVLIEKNIIYGSRDKGISVGGASNAVIRNNIIAECDMGVGVKDEGSWADIDHTTFVRNRIAVAVYSKEIGRGSGGAAVKNSILSSSKGRSYYADRYSSISFNYCLSDIDILPGTGNLCADPSFIEPLKNNFQIANNSPCIDAGDPASAKDPDGSVTDIGAQYIFDGRDFPEHIAPSVVFPQVIINEIMYNSHSDFKSGDWIELYNPSATALAVGGWRITDGRDPGTVVPDDDISDDSAFTFPEGAVIPADGYLVVAEDKTLFTKAYPSVKGCIGNLSFGLKAGETVSLLDCDNRPVSFVSFGSNHPWPVRADGKGSSLELVSSKALNYHPLNWKASEIWGGTPGAVNSVKATALAVLPLHYILYQNIPNPCRKYSIIRFSLPVNGRVKITLHSLSGKLVETITNKPFSAGKHSLTVNVEKYAGGIYLYRMETNNFIETRRMSIY